jgi:hypothetical protein
MKEHGTYEWSWQKELSYAKEDYTLTGEELVEPEEYSLTERLDSRRYNKKGWYSGWFNRPAGGGYHEGYDPDKEKREACKRDVAQTLNSLSNSVSRKGEKSLRLSFANNSQSANNPSSDTVVLDPAVFDSIESATEAVDVMSGAALIASTMKRTASNPCFMEAKTDAKEGGEYHQPTSYVWQALEQAIARQEVVNKWPGFKAFFKSHQKYTSKMGEKDMEGIAGQPVITKAGAITATAYNLLNPDSPQLLGDDRIKKVMLELSKLTLKKHARNRYAEVKETVRYIMDNFDGEEPTSTNDGDGDAPEEDATPEEMVTNQSKLPAQTDGSLFGDEIDEKVEDKGGDIKDMLEPVIPDYGQAAPKANHVYQYSREGHDRYTDKYNEIKRDLRGEIDAVVSSLSFMNNNADTHAHGLKAGDLDVHSLYKLGCETDPSIFEEVLVKASKKIAVTLLVDRSGSMTGTRQKEANKVCIVLAEALGQIDGVKLNIHTHTASPGKANSGDWMHHLTLERYSELVKSERNKDSDKRSDENLYVHDIIYNGKDRRHVLANLHSMSMNADGYAIKHTAKRMNETSPEYNENILFVISDGQPSASGYGREPARNHVLDTCNFCRAVYGIKVYGIGIDDAFSDSVGAELYGKHNYVVLKDVRTSVKIMTTFLRNVAIKAK